MSFGILETVLGKRNLSRPIATHGLLTELWNVQLPRKVIGKYLLKCLIRSA
jgi:hypothetical protein